MRIPGRDEVSAGGFAAPFASAGPRAATGTRRFLGAALGHRRAHDRERAPDGEPEERSSASGQHPPKNPLGQGQGRVHDHQGTAALGSTWRTRPAPARAERTGGLDELAAATPGLAERDPARVSTRFRPDSDRFLKRDSERDRSRHHHDDQHSFGGTR